jgi:membrane protein implicated in regulation of membrane protease activity
MKLTLSKTLFSEIFRWIVVPGLVIYGFYFGSEAFAFITFFYTWVMFVLMLLFNIAFIIIVYAELDVMDHFEDDVKKAKEALKTNKKIRSNRFKFINGLATILYIGLAVLIASTGSVFMALVFLATFVISKFIILHLVKELLDKISSELEKIIEKEEKKDEDK